MPNTTSTTTISTTSSSTCEKEDRKTWIAKELEEILEGTRDFVYKHYEEEDLDLVAIEALQNAAFQLAYRKKYYDVVRDTIVYFPSVARLILRAQLMEEAEKHYYDEDDEWPMEYTKALKSVVREMKTIQEQDNDDDDDEEEYMEKLAMDVQL